MSEEKNFYVNEYAVVDDNVIVGEGTKIWHFSHVQSGARIGKRCVLGQNVNIGNNVSIGNFVKIQNNVSVYEGVTLEDYVFCGPSMVFTNIIDPRSKYPQAGSDFYIKTLVKEGASLGANLLLLVYNNFYLLRPKPSRFPCLFLSLLPLYLPIQFRFPIL